MTLRDATEADAAALSALESACFPDDAWSGASLASHLETPLCLACLLEEGGEVIGYASGRALPPGSGTPGRAPSRHRARAHGRARVAVRRAWL